MQLIDTTEVNTTETKLETCAVCGVVYEAGTCSTVPCGNGYSLVCPACDPDEA
jgi:hypothetical protein